LRLPLKRNIGRQMKKVNTESLDTIDLVEIGIEVIA
jgi:hypothetical protein